MLQTEAVRPELLATLRQLMLIPELEDFYLVGRTGLSLIYGHRASVDIDLFTSKDFDTNYLESILQDRFPGKLNITGTKPIFLFAYINDIKVDFVNNRTAVIHDINTNEGIRIANVLDIAVLKLKAIFQRGSKKDFVDLYQLLQHYTIEELLTEFKKAYPHIEVGQLLLSMQYFGDAEDYEMPILFIETDWDRIKKFIADAVLKYIKSS